MCKFKSFFAFSAFSFFAPLIHAEIEASGRVTCEVTRNLEPVAVYEFKTAGTASSIKKVLGKSLESIEWDFKLDSSSELSRYIGRAIDSKNYVLDDGVVIYLTIFRRQKADKNYTIFANLFEKLAEDGLAEGFYEKTRKELVWDQPGSLDLELSHDGKIDYQLRCRN